MGQNKQQSADERMTEKPPTRQWWILAVAVVALAGAVGVALQTAGAPTPSQGDSDVAAANPAVPTAIREKLAGRWLRPDGGYVMTINNVAEDGSVQVTYENPRPIHVAKAFVKQVAGKTSLYVELRDRNYPGNNYELGFDAAKDQFVGIYHHLGIQQDFDVHFERLK